jgi:hypothetical protein
MVNNIVAETIPHIIFRVGNLFLPHHLPIARQTVGQDL